MFLRQLCKPAESMIAARRAPAMILIILSLVGTLIAK
jgi:hypothetical protein